eukprot:15479411-Alexandrium_andersonii.AAC.1
MNLDGEGSGGTTRGGSRGAEPRWEGTMRRTTRNPLICNPAIYDMLSCLRLVCIGPTTALSTTIRYLGVELPNTGGLRQTNLNDGEHVGLNATLD